MTITQIVLGSLNIIAAGVMLWFAAQAAYARAAWVNHMRQYEQMRDGLTTGGWVNELSQDQLNLLKTRVKIDASTFTALTPQERSRLVNALSGATEEADLARPRSEEEIRQEIARLFQPSGLRTVVTKKPDGTLDYKVVNEKGEEPKLADLTAPAQKLLGEEKDIQDLARKLGPRGFTKLVRAAIEQQYPRLDLDLRETSERLYFARARLADAKAQLERVKAEVALLTTRRDVERQLLAQAEAENLERRREITRLQADVEEAYAAYAVAVGRELDKQRLLNDLQQNTEQTIRESDKINNEIQRRETQSGSGSSQ